MTSHISQNNTEESEQIQIPLESKFQYQHGPITFDYCNSADDWQKYIENSEQQYIDNYLFIGRDHIVDNLVNMLVETKEKKRGCYLLAGNRGVGKTSVINKVICEYSITQYNAEKNKDKIFLECAIPIIVRVNIGHETSNDIGDIFYNILTILAFKIKNRERVVSKYKKKNNKEILRKLNELVEKINKQVVTQTGVFGEASAEAKILWWKSKVKGGGSKSEARTHYKPDAREIEVKLLDILEEIKNYSDLDFDIIFVFDEIDKISGKSVNGKDGKRSSDYDALITRNRVKKGKIDGLLSSLKNFLTTANARFIFSAGREALDAYFSDSGSSSSLYESVFDQVIEVPSLLTDPSDGRKDILSSLIESYVCKRLCENPFDDLTTESKNVIGELRGMRTKYSQYRLDVFHKHVKQKGENDINLEYKTYILRCFINYLSFQSWGNPKRLVSLFESFLRSRSNKSESGNGDARSYYLEFSEQDQNRIILSSEIYSLFQHHLSRQVLQVSDKLTITSLSALHFVLKFHPYGFSRESLFRMDEVLNTHRAPELNNIVDSIITEVLRSYLRRVRNGSYRYRFSSWFEQEILYVSHSSDRESASFNFSLDTLESVKSYYKSMLKNTSLQNESAGSISGFSKISIILGDVSFYEQNYDEAVNYFSNASEAAYQGMIDSTGVLKPCEEIDEELLQIYVEAMAKNGDMEECRHNFSRAASIYGNTKKVLSKIYKRKEYDDKYSENNVKLEIPAASSCYRRLREGDSKFELLKQPFWLALYLELKRSPPLGTQEFNGLDDLYEPDDPRYLNKKGNLQFYFGDFKNSSDCFDSVKTELLSSKNKIEGERRAFLIGNAISYAAESKLCMRLQQNEKAETKEFPVIDCEGENILWDTICQLEHASGEFEKYGLFSQAALVNIKILGYLAVMAEYLAFYDGICSETTIKRLMECMQKSSNAAMLYVNASREVNSGHIINTVLSKDICRGNKDQSDVEFSDILCGLFGDFHEVDIELIANKLFWAHSTAGQKVIVYSLWLAYSIHRLDKDKYSNLFSSLGDHCVPPFSKRFSVMYRWLIAREKLTKILASSKGSNGKSNNDDIYKQARELSKIIYSAIVDHRQISNSHQLLVFPLMSMLTYLHWQLLNALVKMECTNCRDGMNFRLASRKVKEELFSSKGKLRRISPSYCDILQVAEKARYYLGNTGLVFDVTSRTRSKFLQKKYYLHDDYSDPEFRFDWMLLHLYVPMASIFRKNVTATMAKYQQREQVKV